jgi:Protein of unknown function (DUF2589)
MPGIQQEATQLLGQIPFGAIIGGPLMAAVTAQGAAAQACVDFIKSVGLNADGTVKTVVFRFSKSIPPSAEVETRARGMLKPPAAPGADLSDEQKAALPALLAQASLVSATVEVPLLSILPIPFIRIDNLTIALKTTVNATTESSGATSDSKLLEGKADGSAGWGPVKVGFSGGISSKKDSTASASSKYSVEHTIDINIHAVQDDIPAGLLKVLNILSDNIKVLTQS